MAHAEMAEETPPRKKSALPILMGIALAFILGGGGFFVMYSGMLGGGGGDFHATASHAPASPAQGDIAFVALDPLIVSLGPGSASRHLRFAAQLEVAPAYESEVSHLMPRVLDVLNSYLRAVELSDLEDRSALVRLRAQMLRRVQVVTGNGRVRDLLITEFVLN
ncbi:MAG: flagellar basal body-associated FliL family protein [Pseudomonadota bacterium]|nr:flagellar basal body-associated FliL family protein [Pseudomonadota bacterium]